MSKDNPTYVLRNCNIFADRQSKIGQASEITIPTPTRQTEEIRNAGMVKPKKVGMGYEALELAFKMTAFDPQVIKLLALQGERDFLVTGALVDEGEDATVHNAQCFMRGTLGKKDAGAWAAGKLAETEFTVDVEYMKLSVDGEVLIEMDSFEVTVGGKSQTGAIRAALLA